MKRVVPLWLAALIGLAVAGTAQAQVLYGLTSAGSLVQFNSGTPGTFIGSAVPITGLTAGDAVVGIDVRPADGVLFGLGYNTTAGTARVYTINPTTGAATQPTPANTLNLGAGVTGFGVDFNPAANALRLVTNAATGNNLRVPTGGTGTPVTDSNLNPGTPDIRAAAYNNNFPGTPTTTLFVIDATANALFTQGSVNGTPTSPNTGTLLNQVGLTGITGSAVTGFDIAGSNGTAFVSTGTALFNLNLGTGAATSLGAFPVGGPTMVGITAVPEPGSLALCGLAVTGLAGYRRMKRKSDRPVESAG